MASKSSSELHDTHSAGHTSKRKVSRSLVAMSSAAVMAVYTAGYLRTKAAAEKFDEPVRRRPEPVVAETAAHTLVPGATALPSEPERPAAASTPEPTATAPPAVASEPRAQTPTATVASTEMPPAPVTSAPESPASTPATPTAEPAPAQPAAATPVAAAPAEVAAAPAKEVWKDGSYLGWGYSRHGNIQAQVVIAGGRIASASIFNCLTRYPCSWIEKLPPQVAERQSADVDYVSGATESADAFYQAVYRALLQAK